MAEERSMSRLGELRRQIDAIDTQLVELLSARASCALAIGHEKKLLGLELYQPTRETEVLGHVQRINPGPLDNEAIKRLFERIIDEARRLERIADAEQEAQRGDSITEEGTKR
jgi:chorismate mutase